MGRNGQIKIQWFHFNRIKIYFNIPSIITNDTK